MRAEGGLSEEPGHELVILDDVNILLLEGALPAPELFRERGARVVRPERVLLVVVLAAAVGHPGSLKNTGRPTVASLHLGALKTPQTEWLVAAKPIKVAGSS